MLSTFFFSIIFYTVSVINIQTSLASTHKHPNIHNNIITRYPKYPKHPKCIKENPNNNHKGHIQNEQSQPLDTNLAYRFVILTSFPSITFLYSRLTRSTWISWPDV